LSSQSAY